MDQLLSSERPSEPSMTGPQGTGPNPGSYGRMTPPNSMTPPPNQMVPPGYGSINPMPGGGMYAPARPPRAPGHLSVVQMKLLSAQIKAYRYLARNLALPEQLRTVILSHASSTTSSSLPARSSLSPAPQTVRDNNATPPLSTYQTPVSKQPDVSASPVPSTAANTTPPITTPASSTQQKPSPSVTPVSTGSTTPSSVKQDSTATKGQAQLKPVKLAPVTLPKGVDPDLVQKERESRIRARIIHRVNELEALPSGLPDDLYRKAMIELKSLRLLDFQRQVSF